jgi:hypothetical protein
VNSQSTINRLTALLVIPKMTVATKPSRTFFC